MQCEILSGDVPVGFLRWERQGLYTRFYGEVTVQTVTKVFGVFEGGVCPLGIPVPEQGKMVLRVSMPTARLPGGRLLQGRLDDGQVGWRPFSGGIMGGIYYPAGMKKDNALRFPWKVGEPLPAPEVVLFYEMVQEQGRTWLQIRHKADGTPKVDE